MPSSDVRSRRSGHTPSWTPATQTRSHSRPLAAWAVSSRTVCPATDRVAPTSPGSSWAERCATKARTSADGSRSTKPAAASNSATIASRSRSATAPDGPPAALAFAHRWARPLLCHIAQSTSSAVPSSASVTRPASSTAATRRAGRETWSGIASSSASSPSAMASGAPRSAASMPCLASAIRTERRSRRRSRTVAPPSGDASSASAAGSSSPVGAPSGPGRSAVSALSSGATAGCAASGRSSEETATGTPDEDSARRSGPSAPAVRTTTAICDQGTPPSRWARRRTSAR